MKARVLLLLVLALLNLAAILPDDAPTSLLTLINKNRAEDVHVGLLGINNGRFYYFTERAKDHPEETVFEVHKDVYLVAIYACGYKRTGTLNMHKNVRLVFPLCFYNNAYRGAPNAGEPSLEKVDLLKTEPQDGALDELLLERLSLNERFTGDIRSAITDEDLLRYLYPPYRAQIHWRLDWYNWYNGSLDGFEPFH